MLHKVKKIFIGDFTGPQEEVEEFVEQLRKDFQEAGFQLVESKQEADGVLRGALMMRKTTDRFGGNLLLALERMGAFALDDEDILRAVLKLSTPQGKKIWAGNFQRGVRSLGGTDLARVRAKDVMKKFLRDYQTAKMMSDVPGSANDTEFPYQE